MSDDVKRFDFGARDADGSKPIYVRADVYDAVCAELADTQRGVACLLREKEALRAEVERLRGALEKYGHHLSSCRTTDWTLGVKAWDDASCDCGLRAALAAEQPAGGK